jgi:hypothetical protein
VRPSLSACVITEFYWVLGLGSNYVGVSLEMVSELRKRRIWPRNSSQKDLASPEAQCQVDHQRAAQAPRRRVACSQNTNPPFRRCPGSRRYPRHLDYVTSV